MVAFLSFHNVIMAGFQASSQPRISHAIYCYHWDYLLFLSGAAICGQYLNYIALPASITWPINRIATLNHEFLWAPWKRQVTFEGGWLLFKIDLKMLHYVQSWPPPPSGGPPKIPNSELHFFWPALYMLTLSNGISKIVLFCTLKVCQTDASWYLHSKKKGY